LKKGFVNLTAVQAKVYDSVKEGGDIVVRSRTGTGKTLAFGIPLIEKCADERGGNGREVRLVIMEPTRELAIQVTEELKALCNDHGLSIMTVYGGASMVTQRETLQRGVDIVVATPGRLLDHIVQGNIQMGTVNHVVLDEGDVMLEMGFQKSVQSILENVRSPGEEARRKAGSALRDDASSYRRGESPLQQSQSSRNKGQDQDGASSRHTQVLLFSATMPPWICKITEEHMETPVFFDAVQEGETKLAPTIEHLYMILPKSRSRIDTYASYADDIVAVKGTGKQTIVFTNTREEANTIVASESFQQLRVGVLHGDISQSGRQQVIKTFKEGKLDVLVATDVAARGLDISGVDLVIQLGVPGDANTYVHRSGRTGRSGRNGTSVVLCADMDCYKLQLLERQLNMKFTKMHPPSARDILHNIVKITTNKFLKDISHRSALLKDFFDESEGILDHFENVIIGHSNEKASDLISTTAEGGKMYSPLFVRHLLSRCLAGLAGSKQPKPR
jgi:ATP-dependent RNA helicase DDX21